MTRKVDVRRAILHGGLCGWIFLVSGEAAKADASTPESPLARFSGVIGQSQPLGTPPLPFLGAYGVAVDRQGIVWTASQTTLYGLARTNDGGWTIQDTKDLPSGTETALGLDWDGTRLLGVGQETIWAFSPESGMFEEAARLPPGEHIGGFTAAPGGLAKGFAAAHSLFILQGDQVYGCSPTGNDEVLKLERPESAPWQYDALGIEPSTGDLLVGSSYPDAKIYRYEVSAEGSGIQVIRGSWPRPGGSTILPVLPDQAWMLNGNEATPLSPSPSGEFAAGTLGPYWIAAANGLAKDPAGGYWISCRQGLLHVDGKVRRLGGTPGIGAMAIDNDGNLVALAEEGQRLIRFSIDDGPDDPVRSSTDGPFRIGGSWQGRGNDLAWDGRRFLVTDRISRCLWTVLLPELQDEKSGWGKLTGAGALAGPQATARIGNGDFILDDGVLRPWSASTGELLPPLTLPAATDGGQPFTRLAGSKSGLCILASETHVVAYQLDDQGSLRPLWTYDDFSAVSGLAASNDEVFVSDAKQGRVSIFDGLSGRALGSLDAATQGGMKPGALTVSFPWLFVADDAGYRVLRFRLTPTKAP